MIGFVIGIFVVVAVVVIAAIVVRSKAVSKYDERRHVFACVRTTGHGDQPLDFEVGQSDDFVDGL